MKKINIEEIREQAKTLGITELPLTTLYARPLIATIRKATYYPEPAEAVEHYMQYLLRLKSFLHARKGHIGKTRQYAYLAPEQRLYVEVLDRVVGRNATKNENHINKIDIYSDSEEHVRKIANFINEIFSPNILAWIVWEKLEKEFGVSQEKCTADWEALLIPPEETLKQAETLGLTSLKETILYARTKKIEKKLGKSYFNVTWAIRSYIYDIEPRMVETRHTQTEKEIDTYYFLAPKTPLFVQVNFKGTYDKGSLEIKIYCNEAEHIRGIAKAINSLFKKGILAEKKLWKIVKIEYDIDEEACIAAWRELL